MNEWHVPYKKGAKARYLPGHHKATFGPVRFREIPNPTGLCKCGCGEVTTIAPYTRGNRGWIEGEHVNYIAGHQKRKSPHQWIVNEETGCWEWQWAKDIRGYGVLRVGDRNKTAYSIIYEKTYGKPPAGYDIHHKCENKACVNPEHLQSMTKRDHIKITTMLRRMKKSA